MSLRPIKGETAMKFWSSANVCNRVRAICAYSKDAEEANVNLARMGYANSFRKRVLDAEGVDFANPLMLGIPFNEGNTPIWECLAERRKGGRWTRWDDVTLWDDEVEWVEWIPDEEYETAKWIQEWQEAEAAAAAATEMKCGVVTFAEPEPVVEAPVKVKKPRKPRKKKTVEAVDEDAVHSE